MSVSDISFKYFFSYTYVKIFINFSFMRVPINCNNFEDLFLYHYTNYDHVKAGQS